MRASGDSRDWFRCRHRESAAVTAWAEFADGQARRKGPDGRIQLEPDTQTRRLRQRQDDAGCVCRTRHVQPWSPRLCQCQRPIRLVPYPRRNLHSDGVHPEGSVIIIDESSAAPSSRLGHSVAVTTMSEINLIFRKQASVVFYVSAQNWMIAPSIRRDCKEVWMPVSKNALEVEDDQDMAPGPKTRQKTTGTSTLPGTSGTTSRTRRGI